MMSCYCLCCAHGGIGVTHCAELMFVHSLDVWQQPSTKLAGAVTAGN
jgi:hypothetical protein